MIVRSGSPIAPNVGPLLGMTIPTVEGKLRLGYDSGGMGMLIPVSPARRFLVNRRTGLRGLNGVSISNLTGGSSTTFKVGDRWQIDITGAPPNAPVFLNAGVCSPDFSRCAELPMSGQQDIALSIWTGRNQNGQDAIGQTDAAGNFRTGGVFTSSQIGLWTQTWNVQGVLFGLPQFVVTDAAGNAQYGGQVIPTGTPYYTMASNHPADPSLAPKPVVLSLADQLAALKEYLLPTGQLAPIPTASAPAVAAPPAVSRSGAKSAIDDIGAKISGAVSGFNTSSIPVWGWLAGAGVAAYLIFGGHKH